MRSYHRIHVRLDSILDLLDNTAMESAFFSMHFRMADMSWVGEGEEVDRMDCCCCFVVCSCCGCCCLFAALLVLVSEICSMQKD